MRPSPDSATPVPYPKGHVGRYLATLAAIAQLERPTSTSVARATGLSKGKIDDYVAVLNEQFGTCIEKEGAVYRIIDWGPVLKPVGVLEYLQFR
jgi:hypothetical protein